MYLNRLLWYEKKEKIRSIIVFLLVSTVFLGVKTGFHPVHHGLHLRIHLQWGLGTAIPFTARTPEISSNSSSTFLQQYQEGQGGGSQLAVDETRD